MKKKRKDNILGNIDISFIFLFYQLLFYTELLLQDIYVPQSWQKKKTRRLKYLRDQK